MGLPFQAFYSAAKFAVEGFSEALRIETGSLSIKVVVINPGDFHTNNSSNRRGYLAPSGSDDPYQEQYADTLAVIENDEACGWDPSVLASRLVRIVGCRNPRNRYIIASADQRLAVLLKKILPEKIFASILASHYRIRRRQ
jgi:short-subunit dehydrogenase